MERSAHRVLPALAWGAVFALGLQSVARAQADELTPPSFTAAQADVGVAAYAQQCAACHGTDLAGGQFGPALKGRPFLGRWGGAPLDGLAAYVHASMPPANAGGLDDETYAAILALIARENGVAAGEAPLATDPAQLAGMALPLASAEAGEFANLGIGGVSTNVPIPEWPSPPDRFADYAPVTEAMLDDPPPENWMTWRRSHRGQGYSPLDQITTENVDDLGVAWAAALPPGPNMSEPLVRDGVLYVYAYGDNVFAFDAADGRVLWRYQRHLPEGVPLTSKKSLALWGDKLYLATTDLHLVALDARTGRPAWDRPITDKPGFRNPGGPLAADGVIMQGLTTQAPGGGLIAGFDAETGDHLWTFNTVAAPGEVGGDTWNGLPAEARSGGSSWTSGAYDAETGVALFGTGPTYDTGPLRNLVPGENNDALFTDTTLALRPRTGELVWWFQHMKNDQWDLDWVFDRVIGTIERDGETRRVIMTSGKEGLFDTLDAETGDYVQTVDMGLQNFVTAIDPETGDKTIDPDLIPGGLDHPITVCPHGAGGRNWTPTAFNPDTAALFVTARDVCMEMIPVETGGFLSTHVNVATITRPDSDGRYGLLQALDMESGEPLWSWRQRAPHTTGVLATAGGLLFVGGVDRQLVAHDQATGEPLWRSGLTDTPNGSPISYAVDGRQYVAVVVGRGNPLSGFQAELIPEVGQAPANGGGIYVFALPE
jgi:alcohol dehydrogenase (cytochrome c)